MASQVESVKDLPTIEMAGGWEEILQGTALHALEQEVLPSFLRSQRWFGGKARRIEEVRLLDWGSLRLEAAGLAWLALFTVRFADGSSDLYLLPLAVTEGTASDKLLASQASRVLARLHGPGGNALLHDALADDAVCAELLAAIGEGRTFATQAGSVRAFPTAAFAELRGPTDQPLPATPGPATSSNSLVRYGKRLLMKLFRRVEEGINPDFEVGRFLTEHDGFDRIPRVAGAMEYHTGKEKSEPMTLAILQAMVDNQGDGWAHTLDELAAYFKRAAEWKGNAVSVDPRPLLELADADPPAAARQVIGSYLDAAATLGRRTAELHRALAGAIDEPAFAPEPLHADDMTALAQDTVHQARQALEGLRDNVERLPEETACGARRVLEQGPAVLERIGQPLPPPSGTVKTRCHGDYHLGQVLWVDNDFILLDFEGEPTRTVADRRARQSPLKDVAGMLRSFDYAAYSGLFSFTQDRLDDFARLEPWAQVWQQWTSAAFLRAYRVAACQGQQLHFLPEKRETLVGLLDAFLLNKAFYELVYELNNRPGWVRIPLRGILARIE